MSVLKWFLEVRTLNFMKSNVKYLVVLLFGLLLLAVFVKGSLVGGESYFNFRYDGEGYDSLSFSGRSVNFPIGFGLLFGGSEFSLKFFPVLFGIFSLILMFFILKELKVEDFVVFASLFVLVLSPSFVYLYGFGSSLCFGMFLFLLGLLFLLKGWDLFSGLSFFSLVFINLFFAYLSVVLLFLLFFKKRKWIYLLWFVSILALVYVLFGFSFGIVKDIDYKLFLSDFGGEYGIGLFSLIAAIFGFFVLWRKKYSNLFIYFSFLCVFVLSLYFYEAIFVLNFLVCFFAGVGIVGLFKREWESDLIKQFTLLILILGIVFSGLSYVSRSGELYPSIDYLDGLDVLGDGVVFSSISNGHLISYNGNKNYWDENVYGKDISLLEKDAYTLLHSTNVDETRFVIDKYDISYIYLDDLDISELGDGGFLLLVRRTDSSFEEIFNNGVIFVYEV